MHYCFLILFFALTFAPLPASADSFDLTKAKQLAHSKRWLRLLHYKSHWFNGFRSAVDGDGFFFSSDGAKDPEKELLATITALQTRQNDSISKLSQAPACAFPARFRFLNQELQLGLKEPDCPRWQEFLSRFHGADSATLVFSTAYPNNPASMFGHTFLRINAKAGPGKPKLDLLDYGLSYAALVPHDANNFAFVWYGLMGGYIGTFSSVPYYAKVQEYNSSESRDLWEYDLNLNAEETWWILANVWELEVNSYLDYYFFDENCSYEILTLLEVAKPEWNMSDYLFHMIPGESVKNVTRVEGAVTAIRYRPSLFKKLLAFGETLSSDERKSFFAVIKAEELETASTATLDTAAQYYYYLKQQHAGVLSEAEKLIFQKILMARSKRAQVSVPEPKFDESSRPEWGHHASRISLGFGRQKGSSTYGNFQELGVRFAYHDLLNHDVGFVPFSEINFPNLTLRYFSDEKRFWVQRAEFISIYSLSPWSWLKNALSWKANIAYEVPMDLCSFCHVLHAEGNVGISQSIATDRVRTYQLLGFYGELGSALYRHWRAGPRVEMGLIANISKRWKQQVVANFMADPWHHGPKSHFVSALWGQSYFFSQEWEGRLHGKTLLHSADFREERHELQLQALYYF